MIPSMRSSRRLRSVTALGLLALLGALGTGLPSHSHEDARPAEPESRMLSADHHSHGTRLVEQADRAPSAGPQLVTRTSVDVLPTPPAPSPAADVQVEPLRPNERAPPPGAPRAPPLPA